MPCHSSGDALIVLKSRCWLYLPVEMSTESFLYFILEHYNGLASWCDLEGGNWKALTAGVGSCL